MRSEVVEPVNIGSDELISISDLAVMIAKQAGKRITHRYIDGPEGVRGRVSDNQMIAQRLGWELAARLQDGLRPTYDWIAAQVADGGGDAA